MTDEQLSFMIAAHLGYKEGEDGFWRDPEGELCDTTFLKVPDFVGDTAMTSMLIETIVRDFIDIALCYRAQNGNRNYYAMTHRSGDLIIAGDRFGRVVAEGYAKLKDHSWVIKK